MLQSIKTVDQWTGNEIRSHAKPEGEEKRVAAGLNAIGGRSPGNVVQHLWPSTKISGAPSGYSDYDVVVPFLFASFGGCFGQRAAALFGHAVFHVTGTGAIEPESRYTHDEEGVRDPILLVMGSDEEWHAYQGVVVTEGALKMVEAELARRTIMGNEQFEPTGLEITFEDLAEAICQMKTWDDWRAAKESLVGTVAVAN